MSLLIGDKEIELSSVFKEDEIQSRLDELLVTSKLMNYEVEIIHNIIVGPSNRLTKINFCSSLGNELCIKFYLQRDKVYLVNFWYSDDESKDYSVGMLINDTEAVLKELKRMIDFL